LSGRESALLAAFVVLLGLTAWLVIGVATNGERRGSQGQGGSESAIGTAAEGRDRGGGEAGGLSSGTLTAERRGTTSPLGPGDPVLEASSAEPEASEAAAVGAGSGSLVIVVEDRSGELLAGVRVALRSAQLSRQVVTAERGEARFAELPTGSYHYRVQAPGGPELESGVPIALGRGEARTLTLRLGAYDLAISGRVLNQRGEPVPDIELVALRLFPKVPAERALRVRAKSKTRSSEDGSYAVPGLDEGDYEVRTQATDRYASASVSVRAGVESADIVLVDQRGVGVFGSVTDPRGEPLPGVQVVPLGQASRGTETDEDGAYTVYLDFDLSKNRTEQLQFRLAGYQNAERRLRACDIETAAMRFDVELEPIGETIEVSGIVRTEDGRSVEGETVHLHSRALLMQYRETSDADGRFFIPDVQVGSDYRVFVRPRGTYKDYVRSPVALTRDSALLDIVLEPLGTGRLEGRMIDADGRPVPRFRLWLWNRDAQRRSREVVGDGAGYFAVEDVPAGRMAFRTRALPDLQVGWIELAPGEHRQVVLVVDWGEHRIDGRVVDERREPVSGAQLYLSWSAQSGGLQSWSTRQTVSDADGLFRFEQLGPGPHVLEVRATGYAPLRESHDVGTEPELRLRRISQ
jgi:protocatechuate 3,4-dioxygenase beta subunit